MSSEQQPQTVYSSNPPQVEPPPAAKWWMPLRPGLVADPTARHYRRMRHAVWLYLYLLLHANRRNGTLFRRLATVARDTGVNLRTVRRWFAVLQRHGYIAARYNGRFWNIEVTKWQPLTPPASRRTGSWSRQSRGSRSS